MFNPHPYIIVSMNRALTSKSELKHSLDDAIELYWTIKGSEETIVVTIMEYCQRRKRYSPIRHIPNRH